MYASNHSSADWKHLALQTLYQCGGLRFLRRIAQSNEFVSLTDGRKSLKRRSTPRLAILCYHRVGTGGVPLYSQLPAKVFEAQMRFLRRNYRVISLDQLIQEMTCPSSLEPTIAVTFDDGYRDLYGQAFPILQAYKIPATMFLTVGAIETGEVAWYDRIFLALQVASDAMFDIELDRPNRFVLSSESSRMWAATQIISYLRTALPDCRKQCCIDLENRIYVPEDRLRDRMLTWDQIRTMQRGGISFGAHTMTHPVVSRLPVAEMEWEILKSKEILEERLDASVRHFAFPFGKRDECGDSALSILASGGFASAATTEWGLNSLGTNPFQLRRVQIGEMGSLAMFAFQLNKLFLNSGAEQTNARSQDAFTYGQNNAIEAPQPRK
jgi:peptidoglycan/xylan/chitin deacetylase (PgdA/CDA1 family)